MPLIKYSEKQMTGRRLNVVKQVNAILAEFAAEGINATVRQIFYQFVARDLVKNTFREYKNLANVIDDGRLAGLIDWNDIQDRTRFLRSYETFDSPQDAINNAAAKYLEDLWRNQDNYIEVWIEKDAALGSIEAVCQTWRLPYLSCRGYFSQSEMWEAAQRFLNKSDRGKECHVFHFGDHDPSGIDMSRDIETRLDMFSYPGCATVHRLALNYDQVKQFKPPENFAKVTDCRITDYKRQFRTNKSWELDALHPRIIRTLIEGNLKKFMDKRTFEKAKKQEGRNKKRLLKLAKHYEELLRRFPKLRK